MGRWCGIVAYTMQTEIEPGIWSASEIVERHYKGDVHSAWRSKHQSSSEVNDGIRLTNEISIIADPFISQNIGYITYVTMNGQRWKVEDVRWDPDLHNRLILSVGGVYNGIENTTSN